MHAFLIKNISINDPYLADEKKKLTLVFFKHPKALERLSKLNRKNIINNRVGHEMQKVNKRSQIIKQIDLIIIFSNKIFKIVYVKLSKIRVYIRPANKQPNRNLKPKRNDC